MARYELDEFEADEIFHALVGRKADLDKRAKDLEEKDGLPEAAQAVRQRIELYMPNGEGKNARPGLLRTFAPQRDIEAETRNERERAEGERAADGSQDLFGGGAETGGGHPAGERVVLDTNTPATETDGAAETPAEKPKRSRKKKGVGVADDAVVVGSSDGPQDAEYEIIDASRRLAAGGAGEGAAVDETSEATAEGTMRDLDTLERLGRDLVNGDATLDREIYNTYAVNVSGLIVRTHPSIDAEALRAQVYEEFAESDENAHHLGYLAIRTAETVRDAMTKPIGRWRDDDETSHDSNLSNVLDGSHSTSSVDALNFGADTSDHSTDHEESDGASAAVSEGAHTEPE
jgi:hypothetical protein